MLRLSVPAGQRLEDARQLEVHPGGAESNVCVALASLGRRSGWLSKLPDNPLGHLLLRRLRAARVDTSAVTLAPEGRVGVYYVEFAGQPRVTQVIYDRARSAFTILSEAELDWDYLLDTRVLHLTGITPALGETCRTLLQSVVERAKAKGVAVSFDVNYRRKLWESREAARGLKPLIAVADILICGERDAEELFGLRGDDSQVLAGLQALTPAPQIVLTRAEEGAVALEHGCYLRQPAVPAVPVDRFGAGDAFAAGVLDGWLEASLTEGLRRGAALAALAIAQRGDMLITSRAEMEAVLEAKAPRIAR